MNLPQEYTEKMKKLLGEEFDKYIESFNEARLYGLRANTLKVSPDDLKKMVGWKLESVPWCKEGFYYDGENVRPAKHPYYAAGLFYIQEPSAMSTGAMLNVEPGDRVADLCAAPGGKSTQVAAKLKGEGVLVTNDISASRCKALLKNIEVSGVSNAIITNEDPKNLADKFEGYFNKIIVDAPCSGEGMFRKDEGAVKSWETHKTEFCCSLQRDILKSAAKMLSNDGYIAYSTCTFAPEEDEGMIQEFLNNNSDFELVEIDKSGGFDDGHPEWIENGSEELKKCGRLMPYKIKGEGHFLCLLHKKGERKEPAIKKDTTANNIELSDYFDFMKNYMNIEIKDNLVLHKDSLFCVPELLDLKGLRVMRSGLFLGNLKTKRFEPSQAFAMTLKKEDAKITVDFDLEDENLKRYLRGESFTVDCNDGWALVCVNSYPIGWGKVQKGRLKNKYLPSWMN
ncbi:MAG: RsmF rRNA methyltransferase first C-terminal domain-containing protein [Lachnospirales bacterium]